MICVFAVALRKKGKKKKKVSHFSSHFSSQLYCMFKSRPPEHSRACMVLSENQLSCFPGEAQHPSLPTETGNREFTLIFPTKHSLCLLLGATAVGRKSGTFGLAPPEETIR